MKNIIISGGKRLEGDVYISGAKNAAVAIIPAVLLSDEACRIENIPNISDITLIGKVLTEIGADVRMINRSTLEIVPPKAVLPIVSHDLMRQIRASYYLLGALLGKYSQAIVSLPGGCNLGVRPIDQHLKGFVALGATYKVDSGMVHVYCDHLKGNNVYLDVVSVGATVNIMLAAVKAEGITTIENAAKEPHIVDLANFLNSMGADISGAGTDVIKIKGVNRLRGVTYSIIPDQIEAGTYLVAAVATKGSVTVRNVIPKHLESITAKLEEIGARVDEGADFVRVSIDGQLNKCNVKTMPHPGFPTDMQPQITTLLSMADGTSIVTEGIWDHRFRYVEELRRMGAQISVDGKIAVIEGVDKLMGAYVKATDLRAGAALIIAGLSAEGTTVIDDISHIERGYESIVEKLDDLGADIKKVTVEDRVTSDVVAAL